MKLKAANLKNFRCLEDVHIDFDQKETVFVGQNNNGKTSATTAFRLFLEKQEISNPRLFCGTLVDAIYDENNTLPDRRKDGCSWHNRGSKITPRLHPLCKPKK